MIDILQGGEKIRLTQIQDEQNDRPGKCGYSRLVEVLDNNKIMTTMPIENGKLLILDVLECYNMEFITQHGIIQCQGKIIKRFREKISFYVVFELLTEFEKLQRREYYRLECLLDIKYYRPLMQQLSEIDSESNGTNSKWKVGIATNISGGGIRFNSREQLNKGEMVVIKMHLVFDDMVKDYEVTGNIIVCNEVKNKPNIFESRVQFANINRQDREEIIRFVFEEERRIRQRKKGLV